MGKFTVKKTNTGYSFNLKAGNGEVIGVSEVYTSKSSCMNGINSVKTNALSNVEDQTLDEKISNPKYEIYLDKKQEYRFRLKAKNGEVILASQGYSSKASCKNGIESVKKNAPDSEIVQEE